MTNTHGNAAGTEELAALTIDGRVATITLRRERQRNALSIELLAAVHARMDELESQPGVSVLVITGSGRAFCAGMDLKQVVIAESGDKTLGRTLLGELGRLTLRIRRLGATVIAKVNGAAIGGGCGLVCACDIAVGFAECPMGFPEVDLGLCPAVVAPWVVRKIGPGRARGVLLRGGVLDGTWAHDAGILDHLAPSAEELDALCDSLVASLATGGPEALRATKSLLNELDGSLDEQVIERGADLSASVLASEPGQAALAARLRK